MNGAPGILAVVNPRTLGGTCGERWREMLNRLERRESVECLHTFGDGDDSARVAAALQGQTRSVVVAAGGDGTVRAVVTALLECDRRAAPALAIAPLGTGNNIARGLALASFRGRGRDAVERAVSAIIAGGERDLDVGRVGADVFVGSFAVGMDAAILAARNRWRRRWKRAARGGGYPLYLVSCAANLARHRAAAGNVVADGSAVAAALYDVVVTNTPLYAGEFRFDDGGDHAGDGLLDLHVFTGAREYVREFVAAWRRHVRHTRGLAVTARRALRRAARIEIALAEPLPAQLDGEECAAVDRYVIDVVPHAIRVRVPRHEDGASAPP